MAEGVEGLTRDKTRKPGKKPLPAATVQNVVDLALGPPPGDATHWTGRMLAKAAGVSLRSVQRILEAHQLAPHRISMFKLSSDPKFAEKLKDVVGLYVDPLGRREEPDPGARPNPAGAADEVGPRRDDDARLQASRYHHAVRRPQHPRRHRHRPQHAASSAPRVHPLPQYDRGPGPCRKSDSRSRRQLRNPQTSKGAAVAGATSALDFPLTPTSASWLNAVEGFFAKLTRQRLKRGVFQSVVDLQLTINRFVADTNADPKPFVWTADPKRVLAAIKRGKQTLESIH
jgi:hypothetical protein